MAFLDETGLAELWSLIRGADNAVFNSVSKIAAGSYTGTGTHGESNPTSLTFDFAPKILFVKQRTTSGWRMELNSMAWINAMLWTHGMTQCEVYSTAHSRVKIETVTVNGNTISWYDGASAPGCQLNTSAAIYDYVAFG
jgi:hypothetical protein